MVEQQDQKDITFEGIVDSISFDQFKATFLSWTEQDLQKKLGAIQNPKIQRKLQSFLESVQVQLTDSDREMAKVYADDPLYNIAYFARAVSQMHPGWEQEGFETEDFKSEVVKLYKQYHGMGKLVKVSELNQLLTDFWGIAATTLADNHFRIASPKTGRPFKNKEETIAKWTRERPLKVRHPEQGNVGTNISYNLEQLNKILMCANQITPNGLAPLVVGERVVGGQTFGVLGIPDCNVHWGSPQEEYETARLDRFAQTFQNNYKNWDGVIIDVRGNMGGTSIAIEKIAELLCGGKVPYCLESKKRHTEEAALREIASLPVQEQAKWTDTTFDKQSDLPIFVLMDGQTASAAEAIVPMLKHYKGVTFIGEKTMGCCQYGAIKPVPLPCGGILHMGGVFRYYEDGMVECVGHKPDIDCTGRDALQVAFEQIEKKQKSLNQKVEHHSSKGRV
ncbi:MAG: hypothetical protein J6Y85_03425 [Alphaproteobacteria bacterium]|nr:hypothetical protein [Alphaproteobacteria bacterium]